MDHKRIPVEEIFKVVGEKDLILVINENRCYIPTKTKIKYKIFKDTPYCNGCGLKARYFSVIVNPKGNTAHLRMYSKDGVPFTIDHIIPRSIGGTNSPENQQTMCTHCNGEKGNNPNWHYTLTKAMWEWRLQTGEYENMEEIRRNQRNAISKGRSLDNILQGNTSNY